MRRTAGLESRTHAEVLEISPLRVRKCSASRAWVLRYFCIRLIIDNKYLDDMKRIKKEGNGSNNSTNQ